MAQTKMENEHANERLENDVLEPERENCHVNSDVTLSTKNYEVKFAIMLVDIFDNAINTSMNTIFDNMIDDMIEAICEVKYKEWKEIKKKPEQNINESWVNKTAVCYKKNENKHQNDVNLKHIQGENNIISNSANG